MACKSYPAKIVNIMHQYYDPWNRMPGTYAVQVNRFLNTIIHFWLSATILNAQMNGHPPITEKK